MNDLPDQPGIFGLFSAPNFPTAATETVKVQTTAAAPASPRYLRLFWNNFSVKSFYNELAFRN